MIEHSHSHCRIALTASLDLFLREFKNLFVFATHTETVGVCTDTLGNKTGFRRRASKHLDLTAKLTGSKMSQR